MSKKEKLEFLLFVPLAFIYSFIKPIVKLFKKLFGFIVICFFMLVGPLFVRKRKEEATCNENDFADFVENKNG